MDTFFEQIIAIKKTGGKIFGLFGLWFLAFLICVALFLFGGAFLGSLVPIVIFGVLFGAYKLSGTFNIEYEYIITNGTMDVDKIINKNSRKRMTTFELSGVSRLEKFNPHILNTVDKKTLVVACNLDDTNAYYMVCEREGKGAIHLVFSPDDRIKGAVVKFIPKFIANSAFK